MAKTNKKDRSVYTQEFRETAIKLALVGNKSIAEVARELGLSEKRLYSWVGAWKKKSGKELCKCARKTAGRAHSIRPGLRIENGRVGAFNSAGSQDKNCLIA